MSEGKRLLLCTYYWPPSGGAGVQRSLKFAKYLPEFSINPTVLTVDEHSATYPILDESLRLEVSDSINVIKTKSREPFRAYSKLSGKKTVPRSGFANSEKANFKEKVMRFIRGNFFLPDARKGWNKYALQSAAKLIEEDKIDAVFTSSPPHSSQLIGLKLKRKYGLPWIADLRDPWTDIYYYKDLYPTWIAKKIDHYYEQKVLENADRIIVVSESIKNLFLKKSTQIKAEKIIVIPNGYDPDDFEKTHFKKNKEFTISYTGTIAKNYDLETFAEACHIAFKVNERAVKIRYIGDSAKLILPIMKRYDLENYLDIISTVDHKKSIDYMQSSDALLVLIPDTPENKGILTGKLFEYLASKKPIIGIGPQNGDAAKIISECNAGKMIPYRDVKELSFYLGGLYEQWEKDELPTSDENIEKYSRHTLTSMLAKEIQNLKKF